MKFPKLDSANDSVTFFQTPIDGKYGQLIPVKYGNGFNISHVAIGLRLIAVAIDNALERCSPPVQLRLYFTDHIVPGYPPDFSISYT